MILASYFNFKNNKLNKNVFNYLIFTLNNINILTKFKPLKKGFFIIKQSRKNLRIFKNQFSRRLEKFFIFQ